MKKIDLYLESDAECLTIRKNINKIVEFTENRGIEFLYMTVDCKKTNDRKQLNSFIKWLKELTDIRAKNRNLVFKVTLYVQSVCIGKSLVNLSKKWASKICLIDEGKKIEIIRATKILNTAKIDNSVYVSASNMEELVDKYHEYKQDGISVDSPDNIKPFLTPNRFEEIFKEWSYDRNGQNIGYLSNLVMNILIGYEGNSCIHGSCLGKTIYISEIGIAFFCKFHFPETRLCDISEAESLGDLFSNGGFGNIIERSMEKRNVCMVDCKMFRMCHSGCPLNASQNGCSEHTYFTYVSAAARILKEIIDSCDITMINPYLKLKILTNMAYGNDFKGLEELIKNEDA